MRYIDADALIERLLKVSVLADTWYEMGINAGLDRAEKEINLFPTADVAPKSEVALKIIREVERILEAKIINIEEDLFHGIALLGEVAQKNGFEEVLVELAELKKKYTEGKE